MLIDDVKIHVGAGKGGDGFVAFNKNMMSLGPTGGDGGKGGSVFLEGVSNIGALSQFRNQKQFYAENGKEGQKQRKTGSNGENLILMVPVGTVIFDSEKNEKISEITRIGERVMVAMGGEGGQGNFQFRSSRNTSPKQSTPGKSGEELDLRLELKLIADVGFVGLPNVGKSSFLNELTNAKTKVANYKFTTLEPNLGVFFDLILADIPGLIKGASAGKGLGHKFLRHIERTKIFLHFISAESEDPKRDYETIRKELENYNSELLKKKEYLILSKSDLLEEKELEKKLGELQEINPKAFAISIIDDASIGKVKEVLGKIAQDKKIEENR